MQTFFLKSRRLLLAILVVLFVYNNSFSQADLSISLRTNSPSFAPWTYVTYYVTVKNLSTTNASSGVVCNFPMPVDGRYNCSKLSKGEWRAWESLGPWNIGTIAAGDSATLQTTMFCMDAPTIVVWSVAESPAAIVPIFHGPKDSHARHSPLLSLEQL